VDRAQAEDYASWFRCLADPTRLQLLHLLAQAPGPLTIGELVDAIGVGQSTVSGHVQRLASDEFVFVERTGTTTHVRVNDDCLTALPAAADAIMARDQTTNARAAHTSRRAGAP
jgi:ArsR family transcriptional regulator, arsenate/arsenite/antimonite-responsive transcriptional repressor